MKPQTLLVAALCSLALFFGWKTREAVFMPAPAVDNTGRASAGPRHASTPLPDPPQPPADSAVAVASIAARPLFRPDRQAFREDGGGAGRNYEAELSRLSMIGVLTFGGEPKGVVVSKGNPRNERWEVGRGDSLPGFKVKTVLMDSLVLTADGKEFHLPLYAGAPRTGAGPIRTETTRTAPPHHGSLPRTASQVAQPPARTLPQPRHMVPLHIPPR